MALVPTRQFYPTSFFDSIQSSLSKFQGTKVRLFRYGSSITLKKKHMFYAARQEQNNQFSQNPSRKYTKFVRTTQKESQPREEDRSLAGGKWIEKWNSTRPPNPPKQPVAALDYPSSESENDYENESRSISGSLDGDVDGNDSTMVKIVEKLKQFGYMKGEIGYKKPQPVEEKRIERGSLQDMFYVEEGLLPNPRGGFSKESPLGVPGEGVRFPWEKPKKEHGKELPKVNRNQHGRSSLAELTLPDQELRRLRALTMEKTHKTRIPASGVTREIVNMIHEKWKVSEIVRLKIEGPPALNMRRMHELLERKTGGMVVWRSGTSLSLYRGVSYEVPIPKLNRRLYNRSSVPPITVNPLPPQRALTEVSSDPETGDNKIENEKAPEIQYDVEMDKILDRLGPRFPDWPGPGPLPVDADQLPGVVPNYEPPYRILPYGVRKTLGPRESTSLRRLARFLPPHFIIGRSRQLQGLSVAMIKLWEKSSIAKISLKRGVQLTTSERMAEELKRLTGGILLSRNKDFLVFYRGKDFLSPEVTDALIEQQRSVAAMQDEEEQARLRASAFITPQMESSERSRMTGTLGETLDAKAKWGKKLDDGHKQKIMQQAELDRHAELVRKLEKKLSFAERKLSKAEHALCKVEAYLQPVDRQADPESISEEERFMFRKLGMRMRAFLLLGRRGVFDGTVENMHLHWKYRELVKIVICAKTFEQVKGVALALEAESGGVLVSVDRLSKKKFAVIVYRGREYTRPPILRPKNLLTKRKALARSIEIQRQQALLKHISGVQSKVDKLRLELKQMEEIKDRGDESLYNTLDYAYPTSDDESEEEDDDAYLATYKNEDVEEDKNNEMIRNLYDEEDSSSDTENGEKDLHTGEEEDEEEEEEDLELHY